IPGSLLQVGLESAIRSFIKKADLDHSTKLTYQGEGEFPSFSKDQSIGWFLIISEYINTLINQSLCRSITLVTKKETSSFILTINSVLEEVYTEDFHSKIDLNILSAQAEAVHAHIDFNTTNRANPILSILYKPQSMH
ncbi:MAG: hypothetical protein OEY34_08235, partial [Cyclobacteriaceae bacterium]|nr:hypothetical protein [Cyclobacteriaceae bacterium]